MIVVKEKGYAKINLFLDVLNKREDGFHDIKTVMHSVSLCDDITVMINNKSSLNSLKMYVEGNKRLPRDGRNLAYSAARLFLDTAGITADITIKLKKRIPVVAGLAGGSTDAAAVLRALNRLYKRPFSDRGLCDLAEKLGSDVPFCLLGGTALCEGRGERLSVLTAKTRLNLVVAISRGEYVSTPKAYSELDRIYSDFKVDRTDAAQSDYEELCEFLSGGDFPKRGLFNIFEQAVLPSCPGAAELKRRMIELGAIGATMSGSGPGVFGVFADEETARFAAKELSECGARAYFAQSV